VSDYVAKRQVEVGLIPQRRVVRIHNGIGVPTEISMPGGSAQRLLGVAPERTLIVSAARATREKGIAHLMRAFDQQVRDDGALSSRPLLVYAGDGPQLAELQAVRETLSAR